MKYPIPCEDWETPIEDYEDVVAYTLENDFYGVRLGAERLSEIDVLLIHEMADQVFDDKKNVQVDLSSTSLTIDFSYCTSVEEFFGEVPGILVFTEIFDASPGNSCTNTVFLFGNEVDEAQLKRDIEMLYSALRDFEVRADECWKKCQMYGVPLT